MMANTSTNNNNKNTIYDISSEISSSGLPTGTGSGPFIELPEFKAIGPASNMLNVKMPQSSSLNIRTGALIAMNGDLNGLTSTNRQLNDGGMYYQVLQSEESVSLLIGGKNGSNAMNNYSIIEVENKADRWIILRDESIIAWTGYDFDIIPTNITKKLNSVQTVGSGKVLVSDYNTILQVELQPEDKILISAGSLVATNGDIQFTTIKNSSKLPKISIPQLKLPQLVTSLFGNIGRGVKSQYSKLSQKLGILEFNQYISQQWVRFKYFIRNTILFLNIYLVNRLFSKSIFMEITGPCKLLMSTNINTSNKMFTKPEINKIFHKS